jgi:hypothetical protein
VILGTFWNIASVKLTWAHFSAFQCPEIQIHERDGIQIEMTKLISSDRHMGMQGHRHTRFRKHCMVRKENNIYGVRIYKLGFGES